MEEMELDSILNLKIRQQCLKYIIKEITLQNLLLFSP